MIFPPSNPTQVFDAKPVKLRVEIGETTERGTRVTICLCELDGTKLVIWSTHWLKKGQTADLAPLFAIPGLSSMLLSVLANSCFDPDTLELSIL